MHVQAHVRLLLHRIVYVKLVSDASLHDINQYLTDIEITRVGVNTDQYRSTHYNVRVEAQEGLI